MLTLTGQLINSFTTPAGERNGEPYDSTSKIQLLGEIPLQDGESKNGLIDLTVKDDSLMKEFESLKGQLIRISIGQFAQVRNGKASIVNFISKGARPEKVVPGLSRA
jgi:hypothetical protein